MNTKRILALVLTLSMVFSLALPGFASADDFEIIEGEPIAVNNVEPVNELIEEEIDTADRTALDEGLDMVLVDGVSDVTTFNNDGVCTVTFKPGFGKLNGKDEDIILEVAPGSVVNVEDAPTFTKDNATFNGWKVMEDCGDYSIAHDFVLGETVVNNDIELQPDYTETIPENVQETLNSDGVATAGAVYTSTEEFQTAGEGPYSWGNGTGSEKDPFIITSVRDLEALAGYVNNDSITYENYWFKISGDVSSLDLDDTWTPIGNGYYDSSRGGVIGASFAGHFDGNDKPINNLTVATTDESAAGLFGIVNGGTIKNVKINGNITVSSENRFAGTLVGGLVSGEIDNCHVRSDALDIRGKHFVGGLVGMSYGQISNSSVKADGTITAYDDSNEDGDDVGGLVGFVQTVNGVVSGSSASNLTNEGTLIISGIRQVGGLAGAIDNATSIDSSSGASGVTVYSTATAETVNGSKPTNTIGLVVGRITGDEASNEASASNSTLIVNTAGQLAAVAEAVNTGNTFAGNTVLLGSDIDLTNRAWTPIGKGYYDSSTGSSPLTGYHFDGTFDGDGHTITSLNVMTDPGYAAGLFGIVYHGTIKNVVLANPQVSSGKRFAGAVAGALIGGTIESCSVTGGYGSISGKHFVGGIAGYMREGSSISDVFVSGGAIIAYDSTGEDGDDVGGLVGYMTESSVSGTVGAVNITALRQAGGLVGLADTNNTINGTVNGATINCDEVDVSDQADANKIAFGGLVGSLKGSAHVGGEVTNVELKFKDKDRTPQNKINKTRMGNVTGGTYNESSFAITDATQVSDGITVSKVTRAEEGMTPTQHVLINGPHEHTYGEPVWKWNNDHTATATFDCITEDDSTIVRQAVVTRTVENNRVRFIGTVVHPISGEAITNTDGNEYDIQFKVTYTDGDGHEKYSYFNYGAAVSLPGDLDSEQPTASDWSINGVTRAKACTTFYFVVTENAVVTSVPTTSLDDYTVINIKQAVGGNKTMTYQVQWSLPKLNETEKATEVVATIYRVRDDDSSITTREALLAASNLHAWPCNLDTRNGDYTYYCTNLSSGSTQTIMLQIEYEFGGTTHTIWSDLTHIAIK